MKLEYLNDNGSETVVDIATLQEDDAGNYRVDTVEDFDLLVKTMGFSDTVDFENETGVTARELLGGFFAVVHNRVYPA